MRAARRAGRPLASSAVPSRTTRHEGQDRDVVRADAEERVAKQPRQRDRGRRGRRRRRPRPRRLRSRQRCGRCRPFAAPSATRMPISRVRCVTRYVATPYAPPIASRNASTAKTASIHESAARSAVDARITSSIVRTRNKRNLRIHPAQQLAERRRHRRGVAARVDGQRHRRCADPCAAGSRRPAASDARGRSV